MLTSPKTVLQVLEVAWVPRSQSYLTTIKIIAGQPRGGMIVMAPNLPSQWQIIDTAHYIPDRDVTHDATMILLRLRQVTTYPSDTLQKDMYLVEQS